jgi:DNA-binding MarR family transcriptional regulator
VSVSDTRTPAEHLLGSRARARVLAALLTAPGTISELARATGCAKSAAKTALEQLTAAGVAERTGDRYAITPAHRDLAEAIATLAPPNPRDELLQQYIGKWVALSREGEIVGVDADPEVLARRNRETGVHGYRYIYVPDPDQVPELADVVWTLE